uniref:Uncharacterized protein n=1 Tax=viral metagenome TaxID=1070528 RepID=A0A6M3L130_9ZZZZ
MTTGYRFRIRHARGKWRLETWEDEPPYGPGWQPAYTGAESVDVARAFLDTAAELHWDDDQHLSGEYRFEGAQR